MLPPHGVWVTEAKTNTVPMLGLLHRVRAPGKVKEGACALSARTFITSEHGSDARLRNNVLDSFTTHHHLKYNFVLLRGYSSYYYYLNDRCCVQVTYKCDNYVLFDDIAS